MAASAHISRPEYFRNHYEPECELIRGALVPKPLGTLEHMQIERRLERLLEPFEQKQFGRTVRELSYRHGDEVRIPELVFYRPGARFENGILIDPPLLAIEVLSPLRSVSANYLQNAKRITTIWSFARAMYSKPEN